MRAREFIAEQTNVKPTDSPARAAKLAKETQPKPPYKPHKVTYGKNGVPQDGDPHDVHSRDQDSYEYGSNRGDLSIEAQAAMPGAFSVQDLASDFYGVYRLGIGIAGNGRNEAAADTIGKHPFIMPFAEEEHNKMEKTIKQQGHKTRLRTTKPSLEISTNNPVSPVAKPKRNRYGV